MISGYCNTNTEDKLPVKHKCQHGWAAGPLTIVRNGPKARKFIDEAVENFWRKYFKKRGKKYLDEQYEPPQIRHRNYQTFHKLLRQDNSTVLQQYCTNACEVTR